MHGHFGLCMILSDRKIFPFMFSIVTNGINSSGAVYKCALHVLLWLILYFTDNIFDLFFQSLYRYPNVLYSRKVELRDTQHDTANVYGQHHFEYDYLNIDKIYSKRYYRTSCSNRNIRSIAF